MQLGASGRRWAVATPHATASDAAADAFERGGNAVDAALAAATTLAVVYPQMCGVGGDLFALVQHPDGDVVAVSSAGASPAGIDPAAVRAAHDEMPGRGPLAIVVPGAPAGWEALHRHGGELAWHELFDVAIRSAADGAPVVRGLAEALVDNDELLAADPGAVSVFLPRGTSLAEGDLLVQPALARTLEAIASGGADALYRGAIAEAYAAGLRAAGSPIDVGDLAAHTAKLWPPLIARYRDLDVRTSPPTSQGFVLLEALRAIERLQLDPDPFGPDAGTIALVFAAAARDRERHLADPRHMRVHPTTLLDDGHIAAVCEEVREGSTAAPHPAGGDTVGLVTADARGSAVSLIQSLSWGFGSGILEPATGILAQNRGSGFVLDPEHPNALAPGKQPAHTLMPVTVHRDGRLAAVSGTMGGPAHPQINGASLVRAFDLGMTPQEAVAAPRWVVGGMDAVVGLAEAEADVPDATVELLELASFRVTRLRAEDSSVGHAHLIRLNPDGSLEAGTDPRADGAALAG
ncbi:MAG TPA: gamma-glutamyltransferase [Actinomycetota bacterium]|nr:gamma-glutamyltransferase [Actinomycetota bacterium]